MEVLIPFYQDLVELLGISVLLSSLYMQGQVYVDPTIRAIAVQSIIISILIGILFLHTGEVNLLILASDNCTNARNSFSEDHALSSTPFQT